MFLKASMPARQIFISERIRSVSKPIIFRTRKFNQNLLRKNLDKRKAETCRCGELRERERERKPERGERVCGCVQGCVCVWVRESICEFEERDCKCEWAEKEIVSVSVSVRLCEFEERERQRLRIWRERLWVCERKWEAKKWMARQVVERQLAKTSCRTHSYCSRGSVPSNLWL